MKLNDPPGEIVPLPNELPVTVCGAEVVFFQMTVVPAGIFRADGLNAKAPVLSVVIVTTTVGACVGVGVGFCGVGVGDGFGGIGVGVGFDTVGAVVGCAGAGVGFGGIGLGVGDKTGGVLVASRLVVLALVGDGVTVAVLLSPPQATRTMHNATIKRLYKATRLYILTFFRI